MSEGFSAEDFLEIHNLGGDLIEWFNENAITPMTGFHVMLNLLVTMMEQDQIPVSILVAQLAEYRRVRGLSDPGAGNAQ